MISIWPSAIYVTLNIIGSGLLLANGKGKEVLTGLPIIFLLWWGNFFDPILKALV